MAKILKKKIVDKSVYELGIERVRRAFELFDHVCVSFSGGKDSTIVLHLALEVAKELGRLPLDVIHYDEEAIHIETEAYVRRVSQRDDVSMRWYCVPLKHRNACSRKQPFWYTWAQEEKDKWVRPLPPEAITHIHGYNSDNPKNRLSIPDLNCMIFDPLKQGTIGILMGIRAQESITRYKAVATRTKDNYIIEDKGSSWSGGVGKKTGGIFKVYPIYDWDFADVWTAPKRFGWDYNRAYDLMEMHGIPHSKQRVCPPFGEEPLGGLHMYAECFPEIWDKMVHRVHGANTAGMYARTDLYGYNGIPDRLQNETWIDYIKRYLLKFGDKERLFIENRLKHEIRLHYKKTSDPILYYEHPTSGIGWRFLAMIATRGDFKNRKTAKFAPPGSADYERQKDRYEKALIRFREDGHDGEI